MMIYMFAILHVSKFKKKGGFYSKIKRIEWCSEPLKMAGLVALCFDTNTQAECEIYFMLQDEKTGHRPESGRLDVQGLVKALNEQGFLVLRFGGTQYSSLYSGS